MTTTNQPRPIEYLRLDTIHERNLESCQQLHKLELDDMNSKHLSDFANVGDECLTQLQSLRVNMSPYHYAPNDLSSFISFASKRPIQGLSVDNERGAGSLKISLEACRLLGDMHKLEGLHLSLHTAENNSSTKYVFPSNAKLPVNCWPNMRRLWLEGEVCSTQTGISMFKASPALTSVILRKAVDSWLTALPDLSHACLHINSINYKPYDDANEVEFEALKAAFDAFPLSNNHLQSLRELKLRSFELVDPDIHHLICTHFVAYAPNLTDFPLLSQGFLQFYASHVTDSALLSKGLFPDEYLRRHPFAPFMRDVHSRTRFVPTELWSKILTPLSSRFSLDGAGSDVGIFVNDRCGRIRLRTLSDEPPWDGRASFAVELYSCLTEQEKQTLQCWDAGDYSARLIPRIKL